MALDRLSALARRQHGLVTRAQCIELGLARGWIQHALATGRLERLHPGVYRLSGAPDSWEQNVMAAVLAAGGDARASHRTAARLWELGRFEEIEITVGRNRLPRLVGVTVHRSRDLCWDKGSVRNAIPVTTPMRAILDLGAVADRDRVEHALETGLTKRLFSVRSIEVHRARVARPGRRGSGVLRAVLDERALGAEPADGLLEPRMALLLREAGLPLARFQFPFFERGRFLGRIDFAYPDQMIAIEVDGHETHSTPAALDLDLQRQNALVLAGWTILRFTWRAVVRRPEQVAAEIRRALGASVQV